ncbi:uncharacterized protein LY89DRAFT_42744 [Mollisia scopiformis]|uniref:Uncharacterized protein n=1 Tax=Mollisia scopiformis TaxID=149040 RepID=A0A194XDK4_MOLSC|nr:uncharacterized protein LY89DRAFT_42744 [Mollisia scopiformis]KUJ18234.1 hypothetical protein LY89DRAFT_42744 [Mollisia scopiformis]
MAKVAGTLPPPPVERPALKGPTRSMTHPLRDPKTSGPRRKVKSGEPFDPEELSRRLQAHIVEQKIKSEKRREARAAKAAAAEAALHAQNGYHHVPATAAASFERTTTQAKPLKMHKLAQPVVKAHLDRVSIENERQPLTLLQKTVAMDQAMLDAHLLRNRNQFQWTQEMEEAAEADSERDLYKVPQRTFNGEFAHLIGNHKKGAPRPMSTGDLFWEEEASSPPPVPKQKVKPAPHEIVNDHRNDWAQRDDEMENRKKEKASPFLKKMESSWMLIGKKEKGVKPERRDEGIAGLGSSPPDGKGVKGSFLARFKRHPS